MTNKQPDLRSAIPSWPDSHTFWRHKRVTVTGGSGYLGSCVVDRLRQRGAADITFASLSAGFISWSWKTAFVRRSRDEPESQRK